MVATGMKHILIWTLVVLVATTQQDRNTKIKIENLMEDVIVTGEVQSDGNTHVNQVITPLNHDQPKIHNIELIDKGHYMQIPSDLDPNTDSDVIKILCLSDIHNNEYNLTVPDLPYADIIISAGDMTILGSLEELQAFNRWIKDYLRAYRRAEHSIVIAGNRDQTLHSHFYNAFGFKRRGSHSKAGQMKQNTTKCMETISKNSIYLQDSMVSLFGLNIYGTPWTAQHDRSPWAFQVKGGGQRLKNIWNNIPDNIDILISHSPPYLHGDYALDMETQTGFGQHVGDKDLMNRVREMGNVRFHVFAHVHEGYGVSKEGGMDTLFVNSALLDSKSMNMTKKPIMFFIKGKR